MDHDHLASQWFRLQHTEFHRGFPSVNNVIPLAVGFEGFSESFPSLYAKTKPHEKGLLMLASVTNWGKQVFRDFLSSNVGLSRVRQRHRNSRRSTFPAELTGRLSRNSMMRGTL